METDEQGEDSIRDHIYSSLVQRKGAKNEGTLLKCLILVGRDEYKRSRFIIHRTRFVCEDRRTK